MPNIKNSKKTTKNSKKTTKNSIKHFDANGRALNVAYVEEKTANRTVQTWIDGNGNPTCKKEYDIFGGVAVLSTEKLYWENSATVREEISLSRCERREYDSKGSLLRWIDLRTGVVRLYESDGSVVTHRYCADTAAPVSERYDNKTGRTEIVVPMPNGFKPAKAKPADCCRPF